MDTTTVYYTPQDVARQLKVSERTIRRWIAEGKLHALRFGRQLRIPEGSLAGAGHQPRPDGQDAGWESLAVSGFAKDWDNDLDAEYDRWREHYGLPAR